MMPMHHPCITYASPTPRPLMQPSTAISSASAMHQGGVRGDTRAVHQVCIMGTHHRKRPENE